MIKRHDTILGESGKKHTQWNNSNFRYGWICFQLVSSIDIQVTKYVEWQNRVKGSWQHESLACYIVLIEIYNIRH